ncbi:MAG: amidase [Steroidobacteraceae bacterium]
MDRRQFLEIATALSTGTALSEVAGALDSSFDPAERSLADLQQALATGTVSSEQLVGAYLQRIARFDQAGPSLRCVLALNPSALADARVKDLERRNRMRKGPLHGIPLLIKDNIETCDPVATTAGSLALANSHRPADAPLVARLRSAGAIVLGKSNLSEWANLRSTHSCSGWSALGGQTRNAYDRDRNPSGSSAGSGVAAAASFCAGAIGTETNGSILSPASVNGLVGLKPTVGVVSGQGIVPISPRQDTAGPMCRTVADAALLAQVIAGRPLGFGTHAADLEAFRLSGVRVGAMPLSPGGHPGTEALYARAREVFRREGAVLVDLQHPAPMTEMGTAQLETLLFDFKWAIQAYLSTLDPVQVPSRTLAGLIRFNRAHAAEELSVFGQELFEMAEARGPLSDPAYQKALATLQRAADVEGLTKLFNDSSVEVLLAPSNGPADLIDAVWGDRGEGGWPPIADAAAIAGFPSITVPAGLVAGLPVGITLVARRNQDGLLLLVARAFERAAGARVPPTLKA